MDLVVINYSYNNLCLAETHHFTTAKMLSQFLTALPLTHAPQQGSKESKSSIELFNAASHFRHHNGR